MWFWYCVVWELCGLGVVWLLFGCVMHRVSCKWIWCDLGSGMLVVFVGVCGLITRVLVAKVVSLFIHQISFCCHEILFTLFRVTKTERRYFYRKYSTLNKSDRQTTMHPSNGRTDKSTNRWTDGQKNRLTKPLYNLYLMFISCINPYLIRCPFFWQF